MYCSIKHSGKISKHLEKGNNSMEAKWRWTQRPIRVTLNSPLAFGLDIHKDRSSDIIKPKFKH